MSDSLLLLPVEDAMKVNPRLTKTLPCARILLIRTPLFKDEDNTEEMQFSKLGNVQWHKILKGLPEYCSRYNEEIECLPMIFLYDKNDPQGQYTAEYSAYIFGFDLETSCIAIDTSERVCEHIVQKREK